MADGTTNGAGSGRLRVCVLWSCLRLPVGVAARPRRPGRRPARRPRARCGRRAVRRRRADRRLPVGGLERRARRGRAHGPARRVPAPRAGGQLLAHRRLPPRRPPPAGPDAAHRHRPQPVDRHAQAAGRPGRGPGAPAPHLHASTCDERRFAGGSHSGRRLLWGQHLRPAAVRAAPSAGDAPPALPVRVAGADGRRRPAAAYRSGRGGRPWLRSCGVARWPGFRRGVEISGSCSHPTCRRCSRRPLGAAATSRGRRHEAVSAGLPWSAPAAAVRPAGPRRQRRCRQPRRRRLLARHGPSPPRRRRAPAMGAPARAEPQ